MRTYLALLVSMMLVFVGCGFEKYLLDDQANEWVGVWRIESADGYGYPIDAIDDPQTATPDQTTTISILENEMVFFVDYTWTLNFDIEVEFRYPYGVLYWKHVSRLEGDYKLLPDNGFQLSITELLSTPARRGALDHPHDLPSSAANPGVTNNPSAVASDDDITEGSDGPLLDDLDHLIEEAQPGESEDFFFPDEVITGTWSRDGDILELISDDDGSVIRLKLKEDQPTSDVLKTEPSVISSNEPNLLSRFRFRFLSCKS